MERVLAVLPQVRTPSPYDKVYKEECMFSYDTPLSEGGLYLNLNSLQAFGEEYVDLDFQRNQFPLYLHESWTRIPLPEEELEKLEAKPERMAIGVEGGFQVDKDKFTIEKNFSLILFPDKTEIPLCSVELPEALQTAILKIQQHEGNSMKHQAAVWVDDEIKIPSKYATDLEQLESEKRDLSDPALWICAQSGLRENLWLNLSTGYIGSGRSTWHGSGGTGAALAHYESTGKRYPLAVKLGTITPSEADVYSYASDEDSLVIDPLLETHLKFWGIDMKQMEKTVKNTSELEVEINMAFEFNRITEASTTLVPMTGPCYIGLKNLGNSCYINAVMQVLWMVPSVRDRYLQQITQTFLTAGTDPSMDFPTQMTKLGVALIQGRTGQASSDSNGAVRPFSFKTLVGQGHVEFSSNHQQDSAEYFMHLLEVMDRSEKASETRFPLLEDSPLTSSMFGFQQEERMECMESHRVRYGVSRYVVLALDIPLEMATNKTEVDNYKERELKRQKLKESGADVEILIEGVENGVQKIAEITKDDTEEKVPFTACLHKFIAENSVDGYDCEYLKRKTQASKTTRMKTFPPFLMVQLKRYYVVSGWQPKKMEVLVSPPEELLLESLRGKGPQEGELMQPEAEKTGQSPNIDSEIVDQLVQMGFSVNGAKRAAIAVKNRSTEEAMEWVLAHMEDSDFNTPLEEATQNQGPDLESVQFLQSMGFDEDSAKAALLKTEGNMEAAANWLLSNTGELEALVPAILQQHQGNKSLESTENFLDGEGVYDLIGFISHMGNSTACGHYVCHIKKKGKWIVFNDDKVAISENPPIDLGFMYLYKRRDIPGVEE
eukprot:g2935.t1